jgi:hypothetical protein
MKVLSQDLAIKFITEGGYQPSGRLVGLSYDTVRQKIGTPSIISKTDLYWVLDDSQDHRAYDGGAMSRELESFYNFGQLISDNPNIVIIRGANSDNNIEWIIYGNKQKLKYILGMV